MVSYIFTVSLATVFKGKHLLCDLLKFSLINVLIVSNVN